MEQLMGVASKLARHVKCPISTLLEQLEPFEEIVQLYFGCKMCDSDEPYSCADTLLAHIQLHHEQFVSKSVDGASQTESKQALPKTRKRKRRSTVKSPRSHGKASSSQAKKAAPGTDTSDVPPNDTTDHILVPKREQVEDNAESSTAEMKPIVDEQQCDWTSNPLMPSTSDPAEAGQSADQLIAAAEDEVAAEDNDPNYDEETDDNYDAASDGDDNTSLPELNMSGQTEANTGDCAEDMNSSLNFEDVLDPDYLAIDKSDEPSDYALKSLIASHLYAMGFSDSAQTAEPEVKPPKKSKNSTKKPKVSLSKDVKDSTPSRRPYEKYSIYKCPECEFTTEFRSSLSRHKKTHKDKTLTNLKCDTCGRYFRNNYDLRKHEEVAHIEALGCEVCGKEFRSLGGYRSHMHLHNNATKYKCDLCDQRFLSKDHYLGHCAKHMEAKPHQCDVCKKFFRFKTSVARHQMYCKPEGSQGNEVIIECDECGKTFKRREYLREHKRQKHGDLRYPCLCGMVYAYPGSLHNHKKTCSFVKIG